MQFGRAVARLHQAADSLPDVHALPHLQFEKTADDQLSRARLFLTDADYDYLLGLAARFYPKLLTLAQHHGDYGLCHADLVSSNLRYAADKSVVIFDFGSAAYSFRSYELTVCLDNIKNNQAEAWPSLYEEFVKGYSQVRPLPPISDALRSAMSIYRHIDWIGHAADACPLRMGEEMILGFLPAALSAARRMETSAVV